MKRFVIVLFLMIGAAYETFAASANVIFHVNFLAADGKTLTKATANDLEFSNLEWSLTNKATGRVLLACGNGWCCR